ncbi:MAG: hypothetical protein DRH90_25825 [Deltaproteobacteria bacterium]|nr:MAG: hypothetical protein DRH90_25825 [Deltaproteobacteria bacterium]
MRIIALIASIGVALQTIITLYSGSGYCPTQGCQVVVSLTLIPPLWMNLLGLIFFQAIFWSLKTLKGKTFFSIDPTGLLLLSGLVFDASLLAYQVFVVQTFCAYCLVIFTCVLALNILYGLRQAVWGLTALTVILFSFSILSFAPIGGRPDSFSLKAAAWGVRSCSAPTKEVYLIFSSTCPHCQKVIQSLNQCNSCDLYLNPIDDIAALNLEGIERIDTFTPQTNRRMLELLDIDTIPVLVSKSPDSYDIIRGEENILNYLSSACFTDEDVLYLDNPISSGDEGITVFSGESGECSVTIDCPDESK